jgi:hypothetical protein
MFQQERHYFIIALQRVMERIQFRLNANPLPHSSKIEIIPGRRCQRLIRMSPQQQNAAIAEPIYE